MNFRRIRQFIIVAELGSLSAAAQRLNMVQPALSQSIKKLEENIGKTLFRRSRKGMELNESGRLFLKHAYGIVNQYSRAREDLADLDETPRGQVSVAMVASALSVISVPLCRAVQERYPDIILNLDEGLAANIRHGFEAGWYDFLVSYSDEQHDGVEVEPLMDEELFLIASASSKLAQHNEAINFSELKHYELIVPQNQHGVTQLIDKHADMVGIKINRAQFAAPLHTTIQLIEMGLGYSVLPWSAIHRKVAEKRLIARNIVQPQIKRTVNLFYPASKPMTRASRVVSELIKKTMSNANADGTWPGMIRF